MCNITWPAHLTVVCTLYVCTCVYTVSRKYEAQPYKSKPLLLTVSMAHSDRLLADDANAAGRGVFERLFGLVAEVIVLETVKRGTERVDKVREQVCQGALTQRRSLVVVANRKH